MLWENFFPCFMMTQDSSLLLASIGFRSPNISEKSWKKWKFDTTQNGSQSTFQQKRSFECSFSVTFWSICMILGLLDSYSSIFHKNIILVTGWRFSKFARSFFLTLCYEMSLYRKPSAAHRKPSASSQKHMFLKAEIHAISTSPKTSTQLSSIVQTSSIKN